MAKTREARGAGREKPGVSIAVKLALVTAGLVVVFLAAFTLALMPSITGAVRTQIRLAANEAACVAAGASLDAWTEWFGTQWQGKSDEEIRAAKAALRGDDLQAAFGSPEVLALKDWNQNRLFRIATLGTRIEALEVAVLTDAGKQLVATSYGDTKQDFEKAADREPLALPKGDAVEGILTLGSRTHHVVRGSCPILDREGNERGEFAVYINASAVEAATTDLLKLLAIYGTGFTLLGAGVAWVVGKRLLVPLRLLQDDVRLVAEGDLKHRTISHTRDEIGALAHRFDQMTQRLAEAAARDREMAANKHQMSVAAEVTRSLFPARLPVVPGYDLAGHHETSGQLNGEYYDVTELPGGRFGLLIGAASGTGVPAAMVMAMARSVIASPASRLSDPGAILREANALLSGDLRRGMYVTVLLAVLDPQAGTLTLANAGHAPLLVVRGGKLTAVHSEGIALGFDKGPVFDSTLRVVKMPLQPGDRAVLYTPGITRVQGADGTALGEERFVALVRREAGHPAEAFVARMAALVRKFRGEAPLNEGVTLLTLGRL